MTLPVRDRALSWLLTSCAALGALTAAGCDNSSSSTGPNAQEVDAGFGGTGGKPIDATTADVPPSYDDRVGTSCVITGECPEGLECVGNSESTNAYCSTTCETDANCPATHTCQNFGDKNLCIARKFCSTCETDAQCGAGKVCVGMGGAKFCTEKCEVGQTTCPRYATCQDVSEGFAACVHNAGTCQGDGSLCQPCGAGDNCATGGSCLTYIHTSEAFCSSSCPAEGCPTGFDCQEIPVAGGAKVKQCVPNEASDGKCVSKISGQFEKGDTMANFEMVGYLDTDGNGSLNTTADGAEAPQLIRLNDVAALGYDLILFNVAAGWCGPCQAETKEFKYLIKTYPNVAVFQVIFDHSTPGVVPTLEFVSKWIKTLKAVGYVGVDPDRKVMSINTEGSTPLNMIIDAKTMKVLDKFNGSPQSGLGSIIKKYLPK